MIFNLMANKMGMAHSTIYDTEDSVVQNVPDPVQFRSASYPEAGAGNDITVRFERKEPPYKCSFTTNSIDGSISIEILGDAPFNSNDDKAKIQFPFKNGNEKALSVNLVMPYKATISMIGSLEFDLTLLETNKKLHIKSDYNGANSTSIMTLAQEGIKFEISGGVKIEVKGDATVQEVKMSRNS